MFGPLFTGFEKVPTAEATTRPKGRGKARAPKPPPADAAERPGKLSALDATAEVLAEAGAAMNCGEMIAAMAAKGLLDQPRRQDPRSDSLQRPTA